MRHFCLLLISLLAIISLSQAFPFQTTDGLVKIYGMVPTSDGFVLDIFSPFEFQGSGIASQLKVDVVDSEDRFIKAYNVKDVSNPGYNDRALYFFKFDQPATQIKRARIETPAQDVYSVSWSGVPESFDQEHNNQALRR